MTLFRKGLIRYYTHGVVYGIALMISLYYMSVVQDYTFWLKTACVFAMRVKLGMDKYLIWLIFALFSLPACENFVFDAIKTHAANLEWNNLGQIGLVTATTEKLGEAGNKTYFGLFLLMAAYFAHVSAK